jgi:hypothetical protein
MIGAARRLLRVASDLRVLVAVGVATAIAGILAAGAGLAPPEPPWFQGLLLLLCLILVARGLAIALSHRPGTERLARGLMHAGAVLALGGTALHGETGAPGTLTLSAGEATETYMVRQAGATVKRHLGAWLEGLVAGEALGSGTLVIRDVDKGSRTQALARGRSFVVGDLRLTPIGVGRVARASRVELEWTDRASGRKGSVALAPGGRAPLGAEGGSISVLGDQPDMNRQGQAIEVRTMPRAGAAPDVRWVFAGEPDHDRDARTGPIWVAIKRVDMGRSVSFQVEPRWGAALPRLGLILVLAGCLMAIPGRRRGSP